MDKHWDACNPWRDKLVYVPIERLAECVAGGTIAHWGHGGRAKLDAYILPQPDGRHSLGVRYGAEGSEYYSPHNEHPEKTAALLAEFSMKGN